MYAVNATSPAQLLLVSGCPNSGEVTKVDYDTTAKKDKADIPKVKLAKLQNVVYRRASIIKEKMNKVVDLQACESPCHKCTSKDEVDN